VLINLIPQNKPLLSLVGKSSIAEKVWSVMYEVFDSLNALILTERAMFQISLISIYKFYLVIHSNLSVKEDGKQGS